MTQYRVKNLGHAGTTVLAFNGERVTFDREGYVPASTSERSIQRLLEIGMIADTGRTTSEQSTQEPVKVPPQKPIDSEIQKDTNTNGVFGSLKKEEIKDTGIEEESTLDQSDEDDESEVSDNPEQSITKTDVKRNLSYEEIEKLCIEHGVEFDADTIGKTRAALIDAMGL